MKKVIKKSAHLLIIAIAQFLISSSIFAQAPQKMSYQAIIRKSNDSLLVLSQVGMRISIVQSSPTGTVVYSETQTATTNANGLVSLQIGMGTAVSGTFAGIDWAAGPYYVKTETDLSGGTNYTIISSNELLSVPFALYAASSGGNATGSIPIVQTGSFSGISYTTATASANLISNNGKIILAKGICLSVNANPTEADAVIVPGNSLGTYTSSFTNLLPNTTYYIRAFAISTAGTAYGHVTNFTTLPLSLPTLITDTLSNISNQSAFAKATITDDGGSTITERGFCVSTASMPTVNDTKIQVNALSLSYNSSITSLLTNTTYYIRSYAVNAQGTNYGNQQIFTTISLPLPTITTTAATNIEYTTVSVGGQITSDGGTAVTQRGICYSTNPNPTINEMNINLGAGMGTYTVTINNLIPNTTYYAKAYASSLAGTAYGNEISFTTLALTTPQIATFNIAGIGGTSANSGGNVTNSGGSIVTARGLCWSTNANPTISDSLSLNGSGLGTFTAVLNGLTLNTTYYVRAYATNAQGTGYGNELSFTTTSQQLPPQSIPIIGSFQIQKTDSVYIGGGYISYDGGSAITQQGVCWNMTGSPTVNDNIVIDDSTGQGFFYTNVNIPNTCNITYYIRAYAINANGIAYGNEVVVGSGLASSFLNPTLVSNNGTNVTISSTILADGGCPITERGICWSVSSNPSLVLGTGNLNPFYASNGIGIGTYTAEMLNLVPNTTYYIRSYAKTSTGTYFSNQITCTTNAVTGLALGQTYAGGIIFYLDSTGQHGLVCAPQDQGHYPWGCDGNYIGTTSSAMGSGAQNTAIIISSCSQSNIAAKICDELVLNAYTDWYLPSFSELNIMYQNLVLNGIGGFSTFAYWSSTEYNNDSAWLQFFINGHQGADRKFHPYAYVVRAVRSF
jgi:FlaG/FlaF family flagellin (archaellin)